MQRSFSAVALLSAVALIFSACQRTVTHEAGSVYSTKSQTPPTATFSYPVADPPGGDAPAAYQGSGKARASFNGNSPASSHAYGELDAGSLDFDGTYGAAVYFEPGALAGPNPTQKGALDLMRWRDGANVGGIRVGTDHRGHLVTSSGADVEPNKQFAFQEGCWNWLTVHQKLKSTQAEDPVSEVFLNGAKVLSSTNVNTTSAITGNGPDAVQFGLVGIGASQNTPLKVYLDDSFISSSSTPPAMATSSAAKLCRPLPNVLLIVTDDQRADTVEGDSAANPIAQLAMPKTRKWFRDGAPGTAGGTEFPNGFATTPWCCPSRASIFTGQYAHNHLKKTLDANELDAFAPKLQYSMQRYLRDWWGYRTALFGKFLNGWTLHYDPRDPQAQPPETYFDEYAMFNGQYKSGGAVFPRPCAGPPNNSNSCIFRKDASGSVSVTEQAQYTTQYVEDAAMDFIASRETANDAQPWFMEVTPWSPHEEGLTSGTGAWSKMTNGSNHAGDQFPPFTPTPGTNELDRSDKPQWLNDWVDTRQMFEKDIGGTIYPGLREQQLRTLGDVDDMVDDIFQSLDAKGEANNTIAVFMSDNGYMWREHSPNASGIPDECYSDIYTTIPPQNQVPCGLATKAMPYREAIQVPFFVRWPDSPVSLPAVDSRLVANIDLLPTVLDAVGGLDLTLPQPLDGRSVYRPGQRARLLTEGWGAGLPDWASIVEPDKQYIFTDADNNPDTDDPQWQELYDYPGDGQNTNLYGSDGTPNGAEPPRPTVEDLDALRQCQGATCP